MPIEPGDLTINFSKHPTTLLETMISAQSRSGTHPAHYVQRPYHDEWFDQLEFEGFTRGHSAAGARFKSLVTGTSYYMFLSHLETAIKNGYLVNNTLGGKFGFAKLGRNFSVKLLESTKGAKPLRGNS